MQKERPSATLGNRQSRGGVIGGKGYGFQAAYIVSRIPLWLADPDFTQFLQEGAGDVDVRFDRVEGEERWYVQVKNYLVKPAVAREVFTQFREIDAGSPDTYTHFTLACPGLQDRLKRLRASVEELRGVALFFRSGEDPILDNTWADLERLVEKLNLPVSADFLVSKVHFDTDLAGLRDDDSLRRLFVGSLVELKGWAGVPPEAVARAYEKLALKCHQALRETYTREQVEAIAQEAVEEVVPPRVISDVCPFQGLDAFTETEAEFFFGRQTVVGRLVERLRREPRFLAVLGPSGSGKSSLVQAGLIPRLRNGAVPGSDRWGVIVIRPAGHPFHELQAQGLMKAGDGLVEAVQVWLDDHPEQTRLMLVVDQFEELLVTSPQALCRSFISRLVELLDTDFPVTVALVMRDDFFSRLGQEAPTLLPWLERGLAYVPPMLSRDELEAIVEEPARAVGLVFEAGLVEAILDDAVEPTAGLEGREGSSTMLPLLEFALTQLWKRQREGLLTHEAYEAIGGVTGGLTQWADQAFHGLRREQQQLGRRVLTALVHLGDESQGLPDSRRRRSLEGLCRSEEERETVHQVVRRLADARLLATGRDLESGRETVELIHDALLREWGLLQEWLVEDRRFLAWRQELERHVQAWEESNLSLPKRREPERLLRGRALAEAERWLAERQKDLQDSVQAFIQTSAARAKRIKRLAASGVVFVLLVVSVLALLLWGQRNEAMRLARAARAGELAAQSQAVLDEHPQRGLLLAMEALSVTMRANESRVPAAEQAVRDALAIAGGYPLTGHASWIGAVALSPNGRWLATGSPDNTARLWDLTAVDPASNPIILQGHEAAIQTVAFSPDGHWLATGSRDTTTRLWDLTAFAPTVDSIILQGHEDSIGSVVFGPDGRWLATGSEDATARLWDLTASDPAVDSIILQDHEDAIWTVAFSPDGRWLATGSRDTTARLWDLTAIDPATSPAILSGHKAAIQAVVFSPDGRWLATCSQDTTARLWNLSADPATDFVVLRGHESWIGALAFSPDGRWLATGSGDATARLWNLTTADPAACPIVLRGHENGIGSISFSLDGRWLATGSSDTTARLWDLSTSDPVAAPIVLRGHEDAIHAIAFSPDGRWFVTGGRDATARLWNLTAFGPAVEPVVLHGHEAAIQTIALSPGGRWLVTGSRDATARLWDLAAADPVANTIVLRGHEDAIQAVAFSPDGHQLATGSWDTTARLWNLSDAGPAADSVILRGHESWVGALAFSPDGRWLATGSGDATARLWNLTTANPADDPIVLRSHEDAIHALAFSPDGHWLATGSKDATVRLWNLLDADPAADSVVLRSHESWIGTIAFSSDGHWLATGSGDATARLWDLTAANPADNPVILRGHEDGIGAISFDLEGRWLVTGGWDATARLWDLTAADPAANSIVLRGHEREAAIQTIAFSPDGRWLATGSWDATARLWDLAAADPAANTIVLRGHEDAIQAVAFSPDGRRLITGSSDTTARLWALQLTELTDLACRTAGRNLTRSEWRQYLPDEPYHPTCPSLPVPEPDTTLEERTASGKGCVSPGYFWPAIIALTCVAIALTILSLRVRVKAKA